MGDKTISWDPENESDVIRANTDIEAMKSAGYAIQSISLGKVIATMDPDSLPQSNIEFAPMDKAAEVKPKKVNIIDLVDNQKESLDIDEQAMKESQEAEDAYNKSLEE